MESSVTIPLSEYEGYKKLEKELEAIKNKDSVMIIVRTIEHPMFKKLEKPEYQLLTGKCEIVKALVGVIEDKTEEIQAFNIDSLDKRNLENKVENQAKKIGVLEDKLKNKGIF